MSRSEAIDALPAGAVKDNAVLRNFLVKRVIFAIADDEDPEEFVALDPDLGELPLGLAFGGKLFFLDPDDSTSVHDGTTVIVTDDGYRYKINGTDYLVRSVLDKDLDEPPADPELGDAYIVAASATDDWSGHDDDIAIFTARGWEFITPTIGRLVLVEDEESYYHWTVAGAWALGFGDQVLSSNSVLPAHLLGGKVVWIVENQTTNAPPGSPSDGVQYIIGSSPTGAWAGNAAKLAIYYGSAWIVVTPADGYQAYDKALALPYVYSSSQSAWIAKGGAYLRVWEQSCRDDSVIRALGSDGQGYSWSLTTAPTTSQNRRCEEILLLDNVRADFAYQAFEVEYRGYVVPTLTGGGTLDYMSVGVYVDSETDARHWRRVLWNATLMTLDDIFSVYLGDTSAHQIKIILFPHGSANITGGYLTISNRLLRCRKTAARSLLPSLIPQATGSVITDFTANTTAPNDGTRSQGSAASAQKAGSGYWGKDYSAGPKRIIQARTFGANDDGYAVNSGATVTISLYGKIGSAPANGTDGTLLGQVGNIVGSLDVQTPQVIPSNDSDTLWDYVWVYIAVSAGNSRLAEAEFYQPVGG